MLDELLREIAKRDRNMAKGCLVVVSALSDGISTDEIVWFMKDVAKRLAEGAAMIEEYIR